MIGVLVAFLVTTLQSRREEVSGVRADLATEEIERVTEPEVDVLLNNLERDAAKLAHVALLHQLRGAPADAAQTGVADKHVMRFFRQHKLARARERLEPRFSERRKLVLAVAIGEHRECEEVEPVVARLIERFEDAWLVRIAAAPLEQLVGFVASITTEVYVQKVDHGP